MAMHQINPQNAKLTALDPIWDRVRNEAEDIVRREPELASFIYASVLHHARLEAAVIHRVAERLDHPALSGDLIRQTFEEALRADPDIGNAFRADLVAVYDRDPATSRFIDPLLYFKGFHVGHWFDVIVDPVVDPKQIAPRRLRHYDIARLGRVAAAFAGAVGAEINPTDRCTCGVAKTCVLHPFIAGIRGRCDAKQDCGKRQSHPLSPSKHCGPRFLVGTTIRTKVLQRR